MSVSRRTAPAAALLLFALALPVALGTAARAGAVTVTPTPRQYSATLDAPTADWYASADAHARIDRLAADHATDVTLVISYRQATRTSSDVVPGPATPTDAALSSVVGYAHSRGLHVSAVVHVDPDDGSWRAYISPADRDRWFAGYDAVLRHDASLLQAAGAETFCLGAEMTGVSTNEADPSDGARWAALIADVRHLYSGRLTYSAQRQGGSSEVDRVTFWPLLDEIGISAYWALGSSTTDTVAGLESAWAGIDSAQVQPLYVRWGKPVLFTEVGYRSYPGSHLQPWNYTAGTSYDGEEQARDYHALLQYWQTRPYWAGVAFWELGPNGGSANAGDLGYTMEGKPAEAVFAQDVSHELAVVPDRGAPTVVQYAPTVSAAAAGSTARTVTVHWGGSDTGSGIATVEVWTALDGGAFHVWRTGVGPTYRNTSGFAAGTVAFPATSEHRYTSVCRTHDRVGNASAWSHWQNVTL